MAERTKLVTGVREALKRLETKDFSSRSAYQKLINNAEDCLFAIYKAGLSLINFTQEEKLEFGILLQQALPAIGCRISYIVSNFPPGSLRSSKIERSGLQFLFDDYKDFPVSKNNEDGDAYDMSTALSDFREKEDIEAWDDCLKRMVVDDLDPGVGAPQPSTPVVPSTHWWWVF
ncbi:unnamed protein product [Lymnaea stagnalis]|uniref:Uncharacterized protein n=1 Tax=Lymnaea stagnalis TaxID=6523 RepID=A0AAV2I0K0_LYMST